MLAMATEARSAASEEAERIVIEARDAADRTRQELSGWAAAQRAKVDALVADLVESANRDADAIRAEALRTSMAEAEETARAHIAEAAERAQQEAAEIRGDARNVLNRAVELGDEVSEVFEDLSTRVGDIMTRLHEARVSMEQLLDEAGAPDDEPADDDVEDDDADDIADESADEETDEDTESDEDTDGDDEDDDEQDETVTTVTTTRTPPTTNRPTPRAATPQWTSRWTASSGLCSGAMVHVASEDRVSGLPDQVLVQPEAG